MMKRTYFLYLLLVFGVAAADKLPASKLLEMAQDADAPGFRQALLDTAGPEAVQKGTAFIGEGPDFLFAVDAASTPQIVLDAKPGPAMSQLKGSNIWIARTKLRTGWPHVFHYIIDGKRFG